MTLWSKLFRRNIPQSQPNRTSEATAFRPWVARFLGVRPVPPLVGYSASCTWWDSLMHAHHGVGEDGHLVCPKCGARVSAAGGLDFIGSADLHARTLGGGRDGYLDFFFWLRGRCYPNQTVAAAIYTGQTGKDVMLEAPEEPNLE